MGSQFSQLEDDEIMEESINLSSLPANTFAQSKRFKIGFKWNLDQVGHLSALIKDGTCCLKESEHFPTDIEEKLQFRIRLISNGEVISLSLFLDSCEELRIKLRSQYMLFDANEKHFLSSPEMNDFVALSVGHSLQLGSFNTIDQSFFLEKSFPKDRLTLYFEIEIIISRHAKEVDFIKLHKEAKQKALVDYGNVLKDGNHSDVVLCVGGHQFKAHKIILAARSPVFSAMFNHETKELLESRVDIHDINLEVFNDFLKYIYTGDINLSEADIVGLFIAADMYQLEDLRTMTEEWLCLSISSERVVELIQVADMYSATKLKAVTLDYVVKHPEVTFTNIWKEFIFFRVDILKEIVVLMADGMKQSSNFQSFKKMRLQ